MDRDLDVLTLLLLDPCLTTDEAAREAAARTHTASVIAEARTRPEGTNRGDLGTVSADRNPATPEGLGGLFRIRSHVASDQPTLPISGAKRARGRPK